MRPQKQQKAKVTFKEDYVLKSKRKDRVMYRKDETHTMSPDLAAKLQANGAQIDIE